MWEHHYLSENIIILYFNFFDFLLKWWFFHPFSLFEQKKVPFDVFYMMTWEQENKSERRKEPQIPGLVLLI